MFGSADDLRVFKLPQPVPELLSVADRFQVKPLIRSVQRDGRYRFLALSLAQAGAFGEYRCRSGYDRACCSCTIPPRQPCAPEGK